MPNLSTSDAALPRGGRTPSGGRPEVALLAAKVAPPDVAHATVARSRLLTLLSRAVQRSPLTLLSGPAGAGKTALAVTWRQTQATGRPIAWLTLDDYDDDPATFWSYVVEALSGADDAFAELPALVPGEPPPTRFVPRLAAELAARPRPVVLIVDNADHVTDRAITAGLDLLVRHAGSRLRLVLCARADPLLPLHQYRLAGSMSEIRCDQLAFTADETRDLLRAMGVPVTAEVAQALCTETQGWAVGLRLAAAPLKQGVSPERLVTSLAHDDGSVAQYLFAEVLQNQPAGVRHLLLRVSVTAELWPDLVDLICGRRNARRALAALAHANAFVEESQGAPGGYRIHPLFREMLQAQLAYDHPGEVAALHRVCARWYAAAGQAAEAVGHAIAAEDWPLVTRLLIDDLLVARLLAHGADPALRGVQSLPAGLAGPGAAVIRAAVALAAGRAPAPPDLAEAAMAAATGDRPALRVSAALTCLTASALAGAEPADFLAHAEAAETLLAALPEADRRERRDCVAVLTSARALALLGTDAPADRLVAELRVAAAASSAAGSRRLRCRTAAALALLEALAGHLGRAAQLAGEAEALWADEGRGEFERGPAAASALGWVHLLRYALVEAREWASRAQSREQAQPATPEAVRSAGVTAVLHSRLLRLRHEYDAAEHCVRPYLDDRRLPRWVRERVVAEAVRLAFARGRTEEGLAVLDDAGRDAAEAALLRATGRLLGGGEPVSVGEHPGSRAVAVEAGMVRACQLLEAGRPAAAAEALESALEQARPELLRWPFLDAPPQARRLLRTHPRLQTPGAWLSPSSGAAARPAGHGPEGRRSAEVPEVTQDLSDRELEVLRHLAEMLSTAEIAAAMFISVNTVRTHIRSILRKLGVSRRNQAVRRARERGIL